MTELQKGSHDMKKIAWLLAALMLLSALVLPAAAADGADSDTGMTFTAGKLYSLSKNLEKAPLTFEAVIRLPKGYTERAGMIISSYSVGASKSNQDGITFQINGTNDLELYYETENAKNVRHKFTDVPVTSISTGEWVHIAVVKDDAAGKAHAYINGEFVQTADAATQPYGYTVNGKDPLALCVGGDYRSGNSQYFKGEIREIAVYSDVRTADEIKADAAGIKADSDMLVWLQLSEGDLAAKDLSGNGYDLEPYTPTVNWLEEKTPVTDYAYSFAVVGDTQYIARDNPDNMTKYYQWILDNKEKKNIQCVIGLGDITDSNKTEQWTAAQKSISLLDGELLYTLVRGNHDNASSLNRYLGTDAYYDQLKSRGDSGFFKEGALENAYCTFTVGKTDYLVFMLDFGARDDVLQWVGGILEKYPDHRAIITTHAYMNSDKTTLSPGDKYTPTSYDTSFNDADEMWDKLVSQHENIFLVLSGHIPYDNIVTLQQKGKNGNTVTQMLIDPQGLDDKYKNIGSLGMVAMFYFSEDGSQVSVEYYSILHDEYFGKINQFDLVLYEKEPEPAETTAPETTAAVPETTAPETTSAAPDTTLTSGTEPATDSAAGMVWIIVGITAAVIIAAAAIIAAVISKKRR